MKFFAKFLQNALILILVLTGAYIFMQIFYPGNAEILVGVAQVYTAMKFWPLLILGLIAYSLPTRK